MSIAHEQAALLLSRITEMSPRGSRLVGDGLRLRRAGANR